MRDPAVIVEGDLALVHGPARRRGTKTGGELETLGQFVGGLAVAAAIFSARQD